MTCLFCRIVRGEVKAHEVHRTDRVIAFMDIGPIRPGHVQIVPVLHFDYFDDLPEDLASEIMKLGQRLARVQKAELGVSRVAFLFTGGDVAHAHAHLVPLHHETDITSRRYIREEALTFVSCPHPGDDALQAMADRLRQAMEAA